MKKLRKDINDYLDKNRFVVSIEDDYASRAGNSAQHTAMFILFSHSLKKLELTRDRFITFYRLLYNTYHEPCLHWNAIYWPGQPGHGSRDNLFSVIVGLRVFGFHLDLFKIFMRIIMRAGFMWNYRTIGSITNNKPWYTVDWCGPLMWFIALRFKWNPLNILSDLYLLCCIYIQNQNTNKDKTHTDGHLNLIVACEACRLISNNPLLNKIITWYADTGIPEYALNDYFGDDKSAPINYLGNQVIHNW